MLYPDLAWTLLATSGGLLLLGKRWPRLSPKEKLGVWLIYGGFLFQVYWDVTHPMTTASNWQVIFVTVMVLVSVSLAIRSEIQERNPNN